MNLGGPIEGENMENKSKDAFDAFEMKLDWEKPVDEIIAEAKQQLEDKRKRSPEEENKE